VRAAFYYGELRLGHRGYIYGSSRELMRLLWQLAPHVRWYLVSNIPMLLGLTQWDTFS
jgi:hypothetical protein